MPTFNRGFAILLLLAACVWHGSARANEVEGVRFDDRLRLDAVHQELVLNGAGVRTKLLFKVYAIGLYLTEKVRQGHAALQLPGAKRVAIVILINEITADQFMSAIREKLAAGHGTPEGEAIRHGVEQVNEIIDGVKLLRRGHTVFLDFTPDVGTRVMVNGEMKGRAIPGQAFFNALPDGWVGDRPVSEALKRSLLGLDI